MEGYGAYECDRHKTELTDRLTDTDEIQMNGQLDTQTRIGRMLHECNKQMGKQLYI